MKFFLQLPNPSPFEGLAMAPDQLGSLKEGAMRRSQLNLPGNLKGQERSKRNSQRGREWMATPRELRRGGLLHLGYRRRSSSSGNNWGFWKSRTSGGWTRAKENRPRRGSRCSKSYKTKTNSTFTSATPDRCTMLDYTIMSFLYRVPQTILQIMSPHDSQALQNQLDQYPCMSQQGMADFLHNQYRVRVSRFTIGRTLKRAGWTKKVTQISQSCLAGILEASASR
ncbi:hypothetical protein BKA56DRAFT_652349 [Ilyonectria sp. MPI-CAGE-AT-0026]|nr:hypothetical protein BKA56DRAFT_652349 [Ilyonectria sp. MPI-CAGE-AT-0026]